MKLQDLGNGLVILYTYNLAPVKCIGILTVNKRGVINF